VRSKFIIAATALAAALVVAPAGAAQATTPCDELEIQAHRGYHTGRIDQNTVRSFNEANARGYTIETDIWMDRDGQQWMFHDRDVSRLTTGTGLIDQMSTAQVSALRYRKAGSPLSTLEEAIAAWSQYPNRRVYIEPNRDYEIPPLARQLQDAGLVDNIYFSGYWDYIERFYPMFNTAPKSSAYFPASNWSRNDAVMTRWTSMSLDRVAAYHQAGLEVLHFRGDTGTAVWANAIRLNFDGILTGRPDQLRDFCPTVQ
jgi:glycerophosphoryl diester phosphodiesterase